MKKVLKYLTYTTLALGLFFGKFIGNWIANKLDDPGTRINKGEKYVGDYLQDCDTISLDIDSVKYNLDFMDAYNGKKIYIEKSEVFFYSHKFNKYFNIFFFFPLGSNFSVRFGHLSSDLKSQKLPIVAVVNKIEMSDNYYGTKENPIPILYFDRNYLGKSYGFYEKVYSADLNDKNAFHGSKEEFKDLYLNRNVAYYLSYVMPKEVFDRRFTSKK